MRRDARKSAADLGESQSGIFFARDLDRGDGVERAEEIRFLAQGGLGRESARAHAESEGSDRLAATSTIGIKCHRNSRPGSGQRAGRLFAARRRPIREGPNGSGNTAACSGGAPRSSQKRTTLLPAPSLVHLTRRTGPLRLALAGATRSGTAGVETRSRSVKEITPRPDGVNLTSTIVALRSPSLDRRELGLSIDHLIDRTATLA
jgi:hypothetical protein